MNELQTVKRVLWVTMALNLLATSAKLIVGIWTNSLSLIAGGVDSVFDSFSNVIGLIGVSMAARPADEDHPYGHRKAETMTAFVISTLLFLSAWELAKGAIEKLLHPEMIAAEVNVWSFAAMLLTIVINQIVVSYELRVGRKVHSDVLIADALHTRADVIVSISVLVGLVLIGLGWPLADPILALLISLFIIKTGIDIVRESSPTLMDRIAIPEEEIKRVACSVPGVLTCHRVRSRGNGASIYIDMHIQVDPNIGIEQAHALSHRVQDKLRSQISGITDVTVHAEPAEGRLRSVDEDALVQGLREIGAQLDLSVHDVRLFRLAGKEHVSLHAEVDGDSSFHDAHSCVTELEALVKQRFPSVGNVVVHIEPGGDRNSVPELTADELIALIREMSEACVGEGRVHEVVVLPHGVGWYASLHCTMPDISSLDAVHAASTLIEHTLYANIPQLNLVIVHMEPESGSA